MDGDVALVSRDLFGVLAELGRQAADLTDQPLRPSPENLCGYIETIWAERPGTVWITGWIARDAAQEFAAIIADRRKFPAAIALACYDRADLPANAHAFLALLQTDWQPSPGSADVFLFVGPELRRFIRSVTPPPPAGRPRLCRGIRPGPGAVPCRPGQCAPRRHARRAVLGAGYHRPVRRHAEGGRR